MEVAALEASLVALANSSGDRENASSQRLEIQIVIKKNITKNLIVTVTSSLNLGACSSISAVGFYQKVFIY